MSGNSFIDFFLKIRNSKFFNTLVISVILASALYATLFEQRPIADSLKTMMLSEQNTDVEFMVKAND